MRYLTDSLSPTEAFITEHACDGIACTWVYNTTKHTLPLHLHPAPDPYYHPPKPQPQQPSTTDKYRPRLHYTLHRNPTMHCSASLSSFTSAHFVNLSFWLFNINYYISSTFIQCYTLITGQKLLIIISSQVQNIIKSKSLYKEMFLLKQT